MHPFYQLLTGPVNPLLNAHKDPPERLKNPIFIFRPLQPSVGLSKLFGVYNDTLPLFRPFYPHCLILYDLLKPIPDESGFSSSLKNCTVQFLHSLQRSSSPQKIILNALNARKLRHQTHPTEIRVQDTFKINSASGTPFRPVKTRLKLTCPQIGDSKVYYIIYYFSYICSFPFRKEKEIQNLYKE